jgi:hypothetical protein
MPQIEMSRCYSPAALVGAQRRFARAWFARASLSWFAMGIQAFEAQSAAMAPIRQMVTATAERLRREQGSPTLWRWAVELTWDMRPWKLLVRRLDRSVLFSPNAWKPPSPGRHARKAVSPPPQCRALEDESPISGAHWLPRTVCYVSVLPRTPFTRTGRAQNGSHRSR